MSILQYGSTPKNYQCKQYRNEIYPFVLHIHVSESKPSKEAIYQSGLVTIGSHDHEIFLILDNPKMSTMAHEAQHVLDRVEIVTGDLGSSEARAYLCGWVVKCVVKECKRLKVKILLD